MNNKIIKLCDWELTKEDKIIFYDELNKKLIYNNMYIPNNGGIRTYVNLMKKPYFIKTLNYFEKFYDKEYKLQSFYDEIKCDINTANYDKYQLLSSIHSFIIINNDLIEDMNENNIQSINNYDKKFMKLSLIYKLVIPIINYYLYQKIDDDYKKKISDEIFTSILNSVEIELTKKVSEMYLEYINNNEYGVRYTNILSRLCVMFNIPKYEYNKDYKVSNNTFFKNYLHNPCKIVL